MPRRTTHRRTYSHRQTNSGNPISRFFGRPVVQLGLLGVAALIVVLLILAGNKNSSSKLAETISPQDAYTLYQKGEAFFLDVREVDEWNEYHAPNTTLIPLGELAARVNEVPKDKKIVVVCRSGNRSDQGRDILKQAGFTNVTSMDGGLKTWRDLGYPIEP
jgi:phage shock protein E